VIRALLLLACLIAPTAWAVGPMPAQGSVEVYFTPWDDAEGALLRTLQQAKRTIHVQAYTFSSRNIAWALQEAKRRGVAVEMLTDREQATKNEHSLVKAMHDAGIPIWFEVRYAAAHNKVALIDAEGPDPVVVTGSYNFTFSAQARNAENLVILRGNAPLAHAYLNNWRRHKQDAVAYTK
jgi:phosphatidylserine/phosphatidylglycerophosphate/cardiolipin synthase-like enzyme